MCDLLFFSTSLHLFCNTLPERMFADDALCVSSAVYQLQQEAPHPRRVTCTREVRKILPGVTPVVRLVFPSQTDTSYDYVW